ncbi:MAG: nitroreductase family protein [Marmoricola sp.]
MEFTDVVAKRRMIRRFLDEPVDERFLQRALTHATRAPSAGFTQGWSFLVLRTPADLALFWESTQPRTEEDSGVARPNPWLDGMRTAPVVIVVLASEATYRARYSEADKDGARRRTADMPWWQIDAAMASLLILQTATDEGLGACFFGVPAAGVDELRRTFGVPDDVAPIGAIALGHSADAPSTGSPTRRTRRPVAEVAHDGRWGQAFGRP